MLFAVTSKKLDSSDSKVIAVLDGLSWKCLFESLLPVLERVAQGCGEKPPYLKNHQTWGVGETLYSLEKVEHLKTEEELLDNLLKAF